MSTHIYMVSTFICLFCLFVFPLKAEIQEIVMKWNALLCLNSCEPFLKDQLNNIVGIQAVQISARAGTAVMGWASGQPFSYAPFNLATRTVGIRIADFRLKVLGLVRQAQDSFYLYSPSDGTSFLLAGPIRAWPDRYIVEESIASRPLSPGMKQRLAELAQTGQWTEIEGPLFEPLRYQLILIVEQLKVPKEIKPSIPSQEIQKYRLT